MRSQKPYLTHTLAILFLILPVSIPAHATLVALAPSRDGLVIAADSRLTFLGEQCDGAFKILVPTRPLRTVAAVTGDSVFVAPPPAGTTDVCGYLVRAPRRLDLNAVVTGALERTGDDSGRVSISGISADCVRAIEGFRDSYPDALRAYAGKEIFSVVVASYDPARAASTVRRFVVRMNERTGTVEAAGASETKFDARSARDVLIYGETDWVNRTVLAGRGRRFLNAATLEFLSERKAIAAVSPDDAVAAAGNVIEAASREAEIDQPPSGIGGAIHVMVIGSEPRARAVKRVGAS